MYRSYGNKLNMQEYAKKKNLDITEAYFNDIVFS